MKITLAQLNPIVGDVKGNLQRLLDLLPQVADSSDLLVTPELYLCGYPPRDLLERSSILAELEAALRALCTASRLYPSLGILCGTVQRNQRPNGKRLLNSALLILNGEILGQQDKMLLPSYDVFDETRHFDERSKPAVIAFKEETLGVCICEDAWSFHQDASWPLYDKNPVQELVAGGASLIINLSASPFQRRQRLLRYQIAAEHVRHHQLPFVLVNQVGANDELLFDGRSFALNEEGSPLAYLPAFEERVRTIDTRSTTFTDVLPESTETEDVRQALTMGVRDYFHKVGVQQALVGLSGGIDSALTLCIAVDALGAGNVQAVTMPGPYSSAGSVTDSELLAKRLGVNLLNLPIIPIFDAFHNTLAPIFENLEADTTEENLQARIRGALLMALSNKFGSLSLATSNKSELAVGYATLYGDMVGALAVIADLFKTQVYELARQWNEKSEIIPQAILEKPPSAELRPDQKDSDSLPPYEQLDGILSLYLEEGLSSEEIIAAGENPETALWVTEAVRRSEYKRIQSATVLRVTHKGFGMGRRIPIAAHYKT